MSPFRRPRRCGKVGEWPVSSASLIGAQRASSSPPSPELERPPARLTPIASVSCASRLSAPSDMPPVTKRFMMASTGSTSSSAMGARSETTLSMSRMVAAGERLEACW